MSTSCTENREITLKFRIASMHDPLKTPACSSKEKPQADVYTNLSSSPDGRPCMFSNLSNVLNAQL